MRKSQIVIMVLLIIGIFISISASILLSLHGTNKDDTEIVETEQNETDTEQLSNENEQLDNKESNDDLDSNENEKGLKYEPLKEKDKDIATESDAKVIVNKARTFFRQFEFLKGADLLKDEGMDKYANEGAGKVLYDLNFQASIIANIAPPPNEEAVGEFADSEGIHLLLDNITDPELALLSILLIDHGSRGEYILNKQSLNPIFNDTKVEVFKIEEANNNEVVKSINNIYPDKESIKRIHFKLDGYDLYGYVIVFKDGRARLHSIHEVEKGTTPYKTVQHWDNIMNYLGTQPNMQN